MMGGSKSLWMEIKLPVFDALDQNLETDVCIVGAGIAGLTCAYTLAKEGKKVVVLDLGETGNQTYRTTAHLTWALDDRYTELENFFGLEGARLAAESHAAAIDQIEKICSEEQIDCDFERLEGYLFPSTPSEDDVAKEFEAIRKIGREVNITDHLIFSPEFKVGPSLQFPRQAQFHPMKYLRGLIEAIVRYGGKIYNHTHVGDFEEDKAGCIVKTKTGKKVTSQALIVATCTPINNRFYIHTKQASYRTYVIAAAIPKGSLPRALYWDTEDPYHYIRTQNHLENPSLEWIIIGGEDHKTGQEREIEARYIMLEEWSRARFPFLKNIEYRWSGQVFEPVDALAFIGLNPHSKNTYICTGDSGNGITHGTVAGLLIPDLIQGRPNPWKDLYDPSRKTLSAAKDYLEENVNALLQYRDWLTPGELEKIEQLPLEEGAILREGTKKIAVYKDKEGRIHMHSAMCPHLWGCVRWNSGEKSWDCPVHGARFDGCGKVLNGPALSHLCPQEIQ